jgi:hypothetical protein
MIRRTTQRERLVVDVSDSSGWPKVAKDVEVILGEVGSFRAHLED